MAYSLVLILAIASGGQQAPRPIDAGGPVRRAAVSADDPAPYAELRISLDRAEFRRLEPIRLKLELRNNSKDLDIIYGDYIPVTRSVKVLVLSEGEYVPETCYRRSQPGSFRGSQRPLGPGHRRSWEVVVNSLFDMTADGEYTIVGGIEVTAQAVGDKRRRVSVVRRAELTVKVNGDPLPGEPGAR